MSMIDTKKALDLMPSVFEVKDFPHGLFYDFQYSLRFELGGEEWGMNQPIRRFMQAFKRARDLADLTFENSRQVHALVSTYSGSEGCQVDLSRLKYCLPAIRKEDFQHVPDAYEEGDDPDEDSFRYWHSTPINDRLQMHDLLWLDIAAEMPITPASPGTQTYLVDFENGLALHAYDDRGLDIIAMDRAKLEPIYTKFRGWLLQYDLDRMTSLFA